MEARVGRIGRPHGIRGQVTVETFTDEPERRFASGTTLHTEDDNRSWTVESHHWHQGRLLLSLRGVNDRGAAEEIRGVVLMATVDADEPAAEAEEYRDRHLIGLTVRKHSGEAVGTVRAVAHLPAQDLLEVDLSAGGVALIPFVAALVPTVDLSAGELILADVDGLIDDPDNPL